MSAKAKRQFNFFDTCSQCKTSYSCCFETQPPLTNERRKIIEAYLKANSIQVEDPFVKTEYVFPRVGSDGYCVFHDKKTGKCTVHEVKPETCVAGPVTFDIDVRRQKIEWFVKMEKICRLAGKVHKDSSLLQKHLKSAKKELLRLVSELDAEALRAILKKDEPETFKIEEDDVDKVILERLAKLQSSNT